MSEDTDRPDDPRGREGYTAEFIPAALFTGGLSMEEELELQTIIEAMNRGQTLSERIISGDEKARLSNEPLERIVHGITDGAIVPILDRITKGDNPSNAFRAVLGGVARMFFLGGVEYGRMTQGNSSSFNQSEHDKKVRELLASKDSDSLAVKVVQKMEKAQRAKVGINEDTGTPPTHHPEDED